MASGSSAKVISPSAFLPVVLTLAVLAGCSSDKSQPPNKAAQGGAAQNQPAAAENPANNAPAQPAPLHRPGAKPIAAADPEPAIDPTVSPSDVFEVSSPTPTFEPAEGPDGPISVNKFDAVFPAKGSDSNHFELAEAPQPQPQPAATRSPAVEEKPAKKHSSSTSTKRKDRENTERSEEKTTEKSEGGSARTLPSGFSVIPGSGHSRVGWPLRIRSRIDGAEMALVTGGAVTVGHNDDPPESSPQITVLLDSFYMDVTEVTLARYERYRQAVNEEHGRHAVLEPDNAKSPPDFPVLGVTLKQAEFYAHWAQKELPTEAEWERAARGEAVFSHPWGNGRAIWSQVRAADTITPVKTFATDVSPFGIYDLAGNAREWCSDRWSPTAFADAQKSSQNPLRNWKGPRNAPADVHVVKGNGPHWDAWYRVGMNTTQHHANVGFRCVLRLNEKE
jgi:formylglycine-generating enzyme required for sulfatase activity